MADHDFHTRLMHLGPRGLTDAELIRLVAGRAVDLTLRALVGESPHNLLEYRGLSPRAASRLVAALELGRRALTARDARMVATSSAALCEYARRHVLLLRREEVHVLCLNARNVVVHHARVAEGGVDRCLVDPREVFAPAVAMRASAIVLVHNHPSGDPEPSVFDVTLTGQLVEAGRLLGIRVLDHLVVGQCVSLAARGVIRPSPVAHTTLQLPRDP